MKRLIVAVGIAASMTPAVAEVGAPFEQTQLDRTILGTPQRVLLAQMGSAAYKSGEENGSPWTTDHNFIAPAQ
jgi:hypothetical protein